MAEERRVAPADDEADLTARNDREDVPDDDRETDDSDGDARPDDHLRDVEPGAGCAEIWEHLSARREG